MYLQERKTLIEQRFVVIDQNKKERLVTTDKKKADQYDKMLDTGYELERFFELAGVKLDEAQSEQLGVALAREKDVVAKLLKGKSMDELKDDLVEK
jgi:dsDNA-binding SOS-regulon protein